MWRVAVVATLLAVGVYLLVDALVVTDAERVEAEVARLVEAARRGGDEAAAEILGALAGDYRGAGAFERERIETYVRRHVAGSGLEELSTGDYKAVRLGEEIVVPIFSVHARARGLEARFVLRLTFAERDGRFLVTDVSQWRLER